MQFEYDTCASLERSYASFRFEIRDYDFEEQVLGFVSCKLEFGSGMCKYRRRDLRIRNLVLAALTKLTCHTDTGQAQGETDIIQPEREKKTE